MAPNVPGNIWRQQECWGDEEEDSGKRVQSVVIVGLKRRSQRRSRVDLCSGRANHRGWTCVLLLTESGVQLLAAQKPIKGPARLVERSLLYFGCRQPGQSAGVGRGVDSCSKADLLPSLPTIRGQELL